MYRNSNNDQSFFYGFQLLIMSCEQKKRVLYNFVPYMLEVSANTFKSFNFMGVIKNEIVSLRGKNAY